MGKNKMLKIKPLSKKMSKAEYEEMLVTLEKKGRDGFGLLGDGMIAALGATGGALSAGAVAGAAGATSIFGLTTAASWIGVTAVAATPVGWIAGCAVAGGVLTYGVSRLIKSGAVQDERRKKLGEDIKKKIEQCEAESDQATENEQFKKVIAILHSAYVNNKISQEDGMSIVKSLREGELNSQLALTMISEKCL